MCTDLTDDILISTLLLILFIIKAAYRKCKNLSRICYFIYYYPFTKNNNTFLTFVIHYNISALYYAVSMQTHPDVAGEAANADKFKRISEAMIEKKI